MTSFIELSEMEKGNEIKNCSKWVNVNFKTQPENRQTNYFSYDFQTKNKGDLLNFTLKLVDSNIRYIAFTDGDKKSPTLNFIIEFLALTKNTLGKNRKQEKKKYKKH